MNFSLFQGTSVQGETPLLWPLWFRAAVPGDISLYMSIYYEVGDTSSVIKYRTLRLHCNVQVSVTFTEWNFLGFIVFILILYI